MTIFYETDRMVVELGSVIGERDIYPLSHESQIWLTCEAAEPHKASSWQSIGDIAHSYEHMAALCTRQAIEAEFSDRLINGKSISADGYIGLWRKALERKVSVMDLAKLDMHLMATVSKPTELMLSRIKASSSLDIKSILNSQFVAGSDQAVTVWKFPLVTTDHCKLYADLHRIYVNPTTYPGLSCDLIAVIDAMPAGSGVRPEFTFDLFDVLDTTA